MLNSGGAPTSSGLLVIYISLGGQCCVGRVLISASLCVPHQVFESMYGLGAGDSSFFINGLQVDMDVHDVFTVLDMMKSEAKLMEGLHALGIKVRLILIENVLYLQCVMYGVYWIFNNSRINSYAVYCM